MIPSGQVVDVTQDAIDRFPLRLDNYSGHSDLGVFSPPTVFTLQPAPPRPLKNEPKSKSKEPLYGEVVLKSEAAEYRWPLRFDPSLRPELYFDADGDGDFSGVERQRSPVTETFATELRMKLPPKDEAGIPYQLQFYTTPSLWRQKQAALRVRSEFRTDIAFGDKVRRVTVRDWNINGQYSDDALHIDINRDFIVQPDELLNAGERMQVDDHLFLFESFDAKTQRCVLVRQKTGSSGPEPKTPELESGTDLAKARTLFHTQVREGPAPQQYVPIFPPKGCQEIKYPSGDLQLRAWITNPPPDGRPRPGIVFLHGGFSFSKGTWEVLQPLRETGFVVMAPMLRGENGNPGFYECFYGEVDDAIAAGQYLAQLPHVDAENVFICGHSVGGVLTTLVAMQPGPYRAAASLSGSLDIPTWIDANKKLVVFDARVPAEVKLRNPLDFIPSLRLPFHIFVERSAVGFGSGEFEGRALRLNKNCQMIVVDGDHATMLEPSLRRVSTWFRENVKH